MLRQPIATVGSVDDYCLLYRSVFEDVRSYECFKWLHAGIVSPLPRKTLPEGASLLPEAIAKLNGLKDGQSLHHFLGDSPWEVTQVRAIWLRLIQQQIGTRPISLCIDETGDVKKGATTDYVAKHDNCNNKHSLTVHAICSAFALGIGNHLEKCVEQSQITATAVLVLGMARSLVTSILHSQTQAWIRSVDESDGYLPHLANPRAEDSLM